MASPSEIDPSMRIAPFRRDLILNEGPKDFDGGPTYTLFDPIRAQYFHLTWAEKQIYDRTRKTVTFGSLMQLLMKTPLRVAPEEVMDFLQTAKQNRLLEIPSEAEPLIEESKRLKNQWWKWFLYKYLYFRIPLFNPNRFLEATRHYVKPLYSKPFLWFYLSTFFVAFYILLTRFSEYTNTFFYFFNMKGFVAYVCGILVVKFIHEFSHAYSASILGIRVPAIGIAFIVLWPVLYTDVTDSWKLKSRRERFFIAFAGVGSELVLAAISTVGWAVTKPGVVHSLFFVISSITWVSSLLMNLNPAMRFDGYYMFSDWVGVSNLQTRAFALARWKLRKLFLGIEGVYPERRISRSKENLLVVYSIYTWIYRLFLYTSIAVLVYLKFTKIIGIVLFVVEIVMFIGYPIIWEVGNLIKMRSQWNWNIRMVATFTVIGAFLFWAVFPWKHTEYFPAITVPAKEQVIYSPYDGEIIEIYTKRGDKVEVGAPIISVESISIDVALARAKIDKMTQEEELNRIIGSGKDQAAVREIVEKIAFYQNQINALEERKRLAHANAEITGVVYDYNEELYKGQYIKEDTVIAKIAPLNKIKAVAFIDEHFYPHIHQGSPVTFIYTAGVRRKVEGVVSSVEPQRAFKLIYPQLASVHGGDVPVYDSNSDGGYPIAAAYFTVDIVLNSSEQLQVGQPGEIAIEGPQSSKVVGWIRYIIQVFWRESSF